MMIDTIAQSNPDLVKLAESEAKLIILEYLSSEPKPVESSASKKCSVSNQTSISSTDNSQSQTTNQFDPNCTDVKLKEESNKGDKKYFKRSDSHMSYEDFVDRRERIQHWHYQRSKRQKEHEEHVKYVAKRNYGNEISVPVKEVMKKYQHQKSKNKKLNTQTILEDNDEVNDECETRKHFNNAKKNLEEFFAGKVFRDVSSAKRSGSPNNLNGEDDESCSRLSYEQFEARREKVKQMLIPIRRINKELRKEIVNFDESKLKKKHQKRKKFSNEFGAQREKLSQVIFPNKREGKHLNNMSEESSQFTPSVSKLPTDEVLPPSPSPGGKFSDIGNTLKDMSDTIDVTKMETSTRIISDVPLNEPLLPAVEQEPNSSKNASKLPILVMPEYELFVNDRLYTPETYVVNCLEAISQDIMLNHPDFLFGAVHNLVSNRSLMTYDNFSQFANSLTNNYAGNMWARIGTVLSVVKEAMIFGDLTDHEVEIMVENCTKFTLESTTGNESPSSVELSSYESEQSLDMSVDEESSEPTDSPRRNSQTWKDVMRDWFPVMMAVLTVGLALAYHSRKCELH